MKALGEREQAAALGAMMVLAMAACGAMAIFVGWALRVTRATVLGWLG